MRLLWAGLFSICLTGTVVCGNLPMGGLGTRDVDFVLNRHISTNIMIQTSLPSRDSLRLEIPWIRIEPIYGNAWLPTACIGWSPTADATWQIRMELLDDKGNVLKHSRDRATVFTCKAAEENPELMRYAEVGLDPMHWENRRHAAKVNIVLEPAQDPMANLPPDGSASFPLVVCAVDANDDKPVADAAVIARATHFGTPYRSHMFLYRTNSRGECKVAFEKADLRAASVTVQKPKHATLQKSWSGPYMSSLSDLPLTDLPERHVMKMPLSQPIGGIVEDAAGKPIADAQVRIQVHLEETGGVASVSRSILTDKRGRWRIDEVPAEAELVSLGFKHPDYISDTWASRQIRGEDLSSLCDRMYVATLTKGLTVSGLVLDDQGRPVPRAAVVLAPMQHEEFRYEHAWTLSNAAGEFRFNCAGNDRTDTTGDGGSTGVLVEAPGYVPSLHRVVVEPNLAPLEFRLSRGHPLTVRVVDANDRPIAGVSTVVDGLTEDRDYGFWLDDTDDQGRVRIPNAPDRELLFTAMQGGYVSVRGHTLPASREEQVVKMKPAPRIQGVVRDAGTRKSIQEFTLVATITTGGRAMPAEPIRIKGGRFELAFDEALPDVVEMKVFAVGYRPAMQQSVRPEGTRTVDFPLTADSFFDARALLQQTGGAARSEPLVVAGTVVDPNGLPVPKATIDSHSVGASEVVTDAKGRFKLRSSRGGAMGPMESESPYLLVRSRDRNLATVMDFDPTAAGDLTVRLAPAMILSGKVTDEQGKEIPGLKMSLVLWWGRMGHGFRYEPAGPAPDGDYEIRAVPPGHRYSVNATADGYGSNYVEARTAEATGSRMELEPMVLKRANLDIRGTVVDAEDKPVPWVNVYCYGRGQPQQRQIKADDQGRFVIRGVCPGPAEIQANLTSGQNRLHGRVQTEGGATDVQIVVNPLDAGGRSIPAKRPSLMGKSLPVLTELGIGSPVGAAENQAVLLCFFDMNQRPSRNAVVQLAKRAEELKQQGVTVIAIQAGEADAASLEQWRKDQGIAIPVGSIKTDVKKMTSAWGVQSLPWLILTDKSHTVTAEGFSVGDLDGILAKNGGK